MDTENLLHLEDEIKALFALCANDTEYAVMKHILQNLKLVGPKSYRLLLTQMATRISEIAGNGAKLAIVASAFDHTPDGSQALLHRLKSRLAGQKNIGFFNSVPNYLRQMDQFHRYLLIDDFCGTGKTLKSRMQAIGNDSKQKGIALDGQALVLAGMERALLAMRDDGVAADFIYECKAGISGHFGEVQATEYIQAMIRIEQELLAIVDGVPVPSLGYGEAEALFAIQDDNAPNSNFPVLWWHKDRYANNRKTVLTRYEQ